MADNGMSVSEAARRLGVGIDQVRKLIYSGKLQAHKVLARGQGVWRIMADSVSSYKAQRRQNGR